ncbi:hypothetical protein [Sulfitobacter sp. 1A13730]|jgi:hypothetical protein|uniref:hypothetical protein n=1 Tax=Sulfitobacter sp. 1A13730 TaxID=3368569 RepID=UPI003745CF58
MKLPGAVSFQPSHPEPQPDGFALCRALPNVARPGTSAGKLVECGAIWLSDFKQTVEASAPGAVHPDFERHLFGSPIHCDFLHRNDLRPSASCCQCNPAVVEHRLRSMMAEQHVRQCEEYCRLGRGGRDH